VRFYIPFSTLKKTTFVAALLAVDPMTAETNKETRTKELTTIFKQ